MLAGALVAERELEQCEIANSTYGEAHWQWIPPGTYCTYSGVNDGLLPALATPAGWNHPQSRRTYVAVVWIVSGVVSAFATVQAQRAKTRSVTPSAARPPP